MFFNCITRAPRPAGGPEDHLDSNRQGHDVVRSRRRLQKVWDTAQQAEGRVPEDGGAQERRFATIGRYRTAYLRSVNEPREVTEIEARSVQDRLSMVTEEIAGESAKRGGEPREGVRGRGRKRQGPAGLPALRPGMTSRTSVLVMPGRGTLARRNGRVGPDGVVDDDEPARAFRRATTRVPRKARLAHASTVGTLGVGCCARRAWRRRSRARGPRPDGR